MKFRDRFRARRAKRAITLAEQAKLKLEREGRSEAPAASGER